MTKMIGIGRNMRGVGALLFGSLVFLFWWLGYPQSLSYHEEKQLFLWSLDYFLHDMSVAGGLADYISEFLVQFFYITWLGALLLAVFFMLFQRLCLMVLWDIVYAQEGREGSSSHVGRRILYALSYLFPCLMLWMMGDVNMLWSFPCAVLMSLAAVWAMDRVTHSSKRMVLELVVIPLLFWLIGGIATWLYILLRFLHIMRKFNVYRLSLSLVYILTIPYLLIVQTLLGKTLLRQWPPMSVYVGLNYYLVPMHYPELKFGYDKVTYELLMQDYLVRHERWDDIIRRAEDHPVQSVFSCNCVNLALSQKQQLAERMFDFYQSGEDALLLYRVRDNMSDYPTMEAFWRLGMVNSCLRYASDLQESILNMRKSGRLTRRIAECHIVNGNYAPAQKNIDLLKQSLFYHHWALEAEALLGDEEAIENDSTLGRVRRLRFKKDMLYSYSEKEKILGQLFINNPENKMALDYFLGDLLLKGQHKNFIHYIKWANQYGGYATIPRGYQDALKSIETHGNIPGSSYSAYGNRMINEQKKETDI